MSHFSVTQWIIFAAIAIILVWGVARLLTGAAKMRDYWTERAARKPGKKPPQ